MRRSILLSLLAGCSPADSEPGRSSTTCYFSINLEMQGFQHRIEAAKHEAMDELDLAEARFRLGR